MITSDKVIGTIQVKSYQVNMYTPEHAQLLSGIANKEFLGM